MKRVSIRAQMLACLFAFTAVTVIAIWACQNLFLEDIYKAYKTREIKDASAKISESLTEGDLESAVIAAAERYDVCVMVLAERGSFEPVSVDAAAGCVIHRMPSIELNRLYAQALSSEGGIIYFSAEGAPVGKGAEGEQSIVLASEADMGTDRAIILLNSTITPVSATVNTLNRILMIITVALIVLSVLLALVISQLIARPITRITRGAARLARGEYHIHFDGGGSKEIDSLASTLNYAKDELSRVDRLQKELIANISHDLRTPLTMISGYSQVMQDIPGEMTAENLQIIIDEAGRLTSLVNDVLDISKLNAGVQTFKRERLCLTELAEGAMERYSRLAAGGYDIRCEFDEPLYIMGDETRVLQVIYNLVNNAVTYTGEDKRVTLRIFRRGEYVRLAVTDTGEGIPKEKLQDIWERYYKVDAHHKRSAVGTGLGLSIVRGIMREHGGGYGVESSPGAGSTFWVDFPATGQ